MSMSICTKMVGNFVHISLFCAYDFNYLLKWCIISKSTGTKRLYFGSLSPLHCNVLKLLKKKLFHNVVYF